MDKHDKNGPYVTVDLKHQTVQHGGGRVILWGCFATLVGRCAITDGNVNYAPLQNSYQENLIRGFQLSGEPF